MDTNEAARMLRRGSVVTYRGYRYCIASNRVRGIAAPLVRLLPLDAGESRIDGLISYRLLRLAHVA